MGPEVQLYSNAISSAVLWLFSYLLQISNSSSGLNIPDLVLWIITPSVSCRSMPWLGLLYTVGVKLKGYDIPD